MLFCDNVCWSAIEARVLALLPNTVWQIDLRLYCVYKYTIPCSNNLWKSQKNRHFFSDAYRSYPGRILASKDHSGWVDANWTRWKRVWLAFFCVGVFFNRSINFPFFYLIIIELFRNSLTDFHKPFFNF